MTFEQMKERLEQIKRSKYYADKAQDELRELITAYQSLTFTPGKVSVQTSNISDPVSKTVIKLDEAQKAYARAWEQVFKEIEDIKRLMSELPADERNILEDYYIRGKSYNYIARRTNYSKTSVYRKLDDGIKKLSTKIQVGKNGKDYVL